MATRKARESELLLQEIYNLFPGLFITIWYPYPQEAVHTITVLIEKLQMLRTTVLQEAGETPKE